MDYEQFDTLYDKEKDRKGTIGPTGATAGVTTDQVRVEWDDGEKESLDGWYIDKMRDEGKWDHQRPRR